jgi:succinyl-diaminopimelate desuccinylase
MSELGERLAADTATLVDVASESREESAILATIEERMARAPGMRLADDEDAVLLYLPVRRADALLVMLAGHVDTVPLGGAERSCRRDGDTIVGRGAADMKGGIAVMLALAATAPPSDLDVGYLFFGREEIPITESALLPLLDRNDEVRTASLSIVLEPTGNEVEVGCNGNLNAVVRVRGRAAHSARPWLGDNAIHAAIEALAPLADLPIRDVEVDGLVFREVVSVTTIHGGIAGNVVPDEVTANVNFRYAPSHSPEEAETRLRELLGHHRVELEIVGNAPPGPVCTDNPLVQRLRAAAGATVRPKQAWTPVAEFAMAGLDAVNFGPGDPRYAHTDDERIEIGALEDSYRNLSGFLVDPLEA